MAMGSFAKLAYSLYTQTGFRNTYSLAGKHRLNLASSIISLVSVAISFLLALWTVVQPIFYRGDFWLFYALSMGGMLWFSKCFNTISFQVQRLEPDFFRKSRDIVTAGSDSNAIIAFLAKFEELSIEEQKIAIQELNEFIEQPNVLERNKYILGSISIILVPTLLIRFDNEIRHDDSTFMGILIFATLIGFFGKVVMRHLSWERLVVAAMLKNIDKRKQPNI